MNRKVLFMINLIAVFLILTSCSEKTKKPYGAVDIEYGKVEELNVDGPISYETHSENIPPNAMRNASIIEEGPERNDETENFEPTADKDSDPDYGGIPIVTKASSNP